jgi:uncharacterized protein Smg (DUF494 family)
VVHQGNCTKDKDVCTTAVREMFRHHAISTDTKEVAWKTRSSLCLMLMFACSLKVTATRSCSASIQAAAVLHQTVWLY